MANYTGLKTTTKNSEATITGEIPVPVIDKYRAEALHHIQEGFELSGFRKGQVPLDILKKHVNEVYVLEEAADFALQDIYPDIVKSEGLKTIGRPQVTITKLAPGNPVAFSIRVGIVPEFSLPDYKKIGKDAMGKQESVAATDKEVDDTIEQILALRKKQPTDPTPKLTDELAKSLGAFETVSDLKTKIRTSIEEEKEAEARRARREAIAGALVAATNMTLPPVLIEEELTDLAHDRDEELRKAGMTMETYVQNMNTTAEKLAKEERVYIERQIKTKFILQKIAGVEKIVATDAEIGAHLDVLRRRHPDAEPERLHNYVAAMIVNEKVLELIEGSPEKGAHKKKEKEDAPKIEAKPVPDEIMAPQKPPEKNSEEPTDATGKSGAFVE